MSESPSPENHSLTAASVSLYCNEDATYVVSCESDTSHFSGHRPPPYDETSIAYLIDCEHSFMPHADYLSRCRDRSIDVTARQDSINWILKVEGFYRFNPTTAMLSVNYLDRFLSLCSVPQPNGSWAFQLLSVACLSLAAKMEEPHVPLLLDLQIFEPKFVFEPKTIQRMELWVMANLDWRLRSITPFDFLHFFVDKLPLPLTTNQDRLLSRVYSASSNLIVSTTRVIDFLGFPPSTIAAAAVLCAARENLEYPAGNTESLADFRYERLNMQMVRSCQQLMEEYLIDTCPLARHKSRPEPLPLEEPPPPPPSPAGVLDAAACGSCETRSENHGASGGVVEPPNKRPRSSAPDVQQP